MQRILYIDCSSGISGDMAVAALLDLGVDFKLLTEKLERLPVTGFSLSYNKVQKHGIAAKKFDVILEKHEHVHRNINDINIIIETSDFSAKVKALAKKMFLIVGEAEAKVHGTTIEKIHFHEVGAIDSIVDILAAAYSFVELKVDRVIAKSVPVGKGFIECAHGSMPLPAPATIEILQGIPTLFTEIPYELTTPTGAAIMKAIVDEFTSDNAIIIEKIGYGAGSRDLDIPNVVRMMLGTVDEQKEELVELICNIDDMNPEYYSYIFDKFLGEGANDVYIENIVMKKSRAAHKLSILCNKDEQKKFERLLFQETTTFGVRAVNCSRTALERSLTIITTKLGDIRCKEGFLNGKRVVVSPEYEDCKKIAVEQNIPLKRVYEIVKAVQADQA